MTQKKIVSSRLANFKQPKGSRNLSCINTSRSCGAASTPGRLSCHSAELLWNGLVQKCLGVVEAKRRCIS
ncbi:hypothetical protein Plhal304r1_c031g0099821 [Plasmopara halstedii]